MFYKEEKRITKNGAPIVKNDTEVNKNFVKGWNKNNDKTKFHQSIILSIFLIFFYSVNEVLFLRLLMYYLVLFQATQILSYAYVPTSYTIISTSGTFSSLSQATLTFQYMLTFQKIRLRSKLHSYSATLTFQILLTFLQVYAIITRDAFNPKSSYAYVP